MKIITGKSIAGILIVAGLFFMLIFQEGCKKDKDTTAPVITITGSNPATACVGFPYVDEGATATDDKDGDISSKIQVTINVDTAQVSNGTVTYKVSDAAGNQATATRVVNVIYCK
jgi:hypothetical protein